MKYSIESKFNFEYGHILKNAYMTACSENLHGHSAKVFIKISTNKLNSDGMVADFKKVKEAIQPIIDEFDHAFFIAYDDKRVKEITKSSKKVIVLKEKAFEKFNYNPTAEAIANGILGLVILRLPEELGKLNEDYEIEIRFYETEKNCVIIRG